MHENEVQIMLKGVIDFGDVLNSFRINVLARGCLN